MVFCLCVVVWRKRCGFLEFHRRKKNAEMWIKNGREFIIKTHLYADSHADFVFQMGEMNRGFCVELWMHGISFVSVHFSFVAAAAARLSLSLSLSPSLCVSFCCHRQDRFSFQPQLIRLSWNGNKPFYSNLSRKLLSSSSSDWYFKNHFSQVKSSSEIGMSCTLYIDQWMMTHVRHEFIAPIQAIYILNPLIQHRLTSLQAL